MFSSLDVPQLQRIQSLSNWPPSNAVSTSQLANAGFSFSPKDKCVECRTCKLRVTHWTNLKTPLRKHMTLNPKCSFFLNVEIEEISEDEDSSTIDPSTEDAVFKKMKYRYYRIQSFRGHWPEHSVASPFELADAGLFFADMVIHCAFCKTQFEDRWYVDNPLAMHRKRSPECRYVQEKIRTPSSFLSRSEWNTLPMSSLYTKPKTPSMVTEWKRLMTFIDSPFKNSTPRMLAECGFYYTGSEDKVICFHCRVTLGDWKEDDDPWVRHARASQCPFLNIQSHPSKSQVAESKPPSLVDALAEEMVPTMRVSQPPTDEGYRKERLREWAQCKICVIGTIQMVLKPCSHFVMCDKCAEKISDCPVCREPIIEKIKAYLC